MAKFLDDSALDALLAVLETADQVVICAGQPVSYAEATTDLGSGSGKALGEAAITSGDWTKADGDTSGRKTTFAQQTGVTIDVTGTADHLAFVDDGGSTLLFVTTLTSQALTAGGTATINSFKVEVGDVS